MDAYRKYTHTKKRDACGVESIHRYELVAIRVRTQIVAAAGRTSVDRSSKATLLLTVPGGMLKSSARDLSVRPFGIAVAALQR